MKGKISTFIMVLLVSLLSQGRPLDMNKTGFRDLTKLTPSEFEILRGILGLQKDGAHTGAIDAATIPLVETHGWHPTQVIHFFHNPEWILALE